MRGLFKIHPACFALPMLLGSIIVTPHSAIADAAPNEAAQNEKDIATKPASVSPSKCEDRAIVVHESNDTVSSDDACAGEWSVADARAYILATALPGDTMVRQGPEVAIGRLHPEFAVRLAAAIREARESGLPNAGVFSAYRPPAFGVGGFSNKFNSLHAYGMAVDMYGIGPAGSADAKRWHAIAAKHGVVCPYGPRNRAEWNHCQPTKIKVVRSKSPLRQTITAQGPLSLENMFKVGNSFIVGMTEAARSVFSDFTGSVNNTGQRQVAATKSRVRTASRKRASVKVAHKAGKQRRVAVASASKGRSVRRTASLKRTVGKSRRTAEARGSRKSRSASLRQARAM